MFVTSSSDDKLRRANALGADEGVNSTIADWTRAVREWTMKRGVDVAPDSVGAATWAEAIRSLARGGRLVTCGATTGPIGETDIRLVFWRQSSLAQAPAALELLRSGQQFGKIVVVP